MNHGPGPSPTRAGGRDDVSSTQLPQTMMIVMRTMTMLRMMMRGEDYNEHDDNDNDEKQG